MERNSDDRANERESDTGGDKHVGIKVGFGSAAAGIQMVIFFLMINLASPDALETKEGSERLLVVLAIYTLVLATLCGIAVGWIVGLYRDRIR